MSFVDLNRKRVSNSLYLVNKDTIMQCRIEELNVKSYTLIATVPKENYDWD